MKTFDPAIMWPIIPRESGKLALLESSKKWHHSLTYIFVVEKRLGLVFDLIQLKILLLHMYIYKRPTQKDKITQLFEFINK